MSQLPSLAPGQRLVDDFEILQVLGAGGFGITYLAHEIALDRHVCIKEYFPNDFAARGDGGTAVPRSQHSREDFDWGLSRFIDEARALARFDHPNIVRVFRYFKANNTAYMVLQYEEGQSLKGWLTGLRRRPRQTEVDGFVAPLLEALSTLHAADLLHRDIAPDNIIIRPDGTPVLIDFGSARGEIAQQTRTVSALVKPGYSPYEQYGQDGSKQGPWTDIYAFSATLYYVVTGRRPPDAPSRIVGDHYVPARQAATGAFRPGFLDAIDQGLSIDIEERPQNIMRWRGALLSDVVHPPDATIAVNRRATNGAASAATKALTNRTDVSARRNGLIALLDKARRRTGQRGSAAQHDTADRASVTAHSDPDEPSASAPAPTPAPLSAGGQREGGSGSVDNTALPADRVPADGPRHSHRLFRAASAVFGSHWGDPVKLDSEQAGWGNSGTPKRDAAKPTNSDGFNCGAPSTAKPGPGGHGGLGWGPAAAPASPPLPSKPSALPKTPLAGAPLATQAPTPDAQADAPERPMFEMPVLRRAATPPAKREDANVPQLRRPPKLKTKGRFSLRSLGWKFAVGVAFAASVVLIQRNLPQYVVRGQGIVNNAATASFLKHQFQPHNQGVDAVRYGNEGQWLITAGADATLKIWSTGWRRHLRTIELDHGRATAIAVRGRLAVTGHQLGDVALWNLEDGTRLAHFKRNEARIWAVALVNDGAMIATGAHDWTLTLWRRDTPSAPAHVFAGHDSAVQTVAVSADGATLASGSADKTVKLWDRGRLSLVRTYKRHRDFVTALAMDPAGKRLASGDLSGELRVWSLASRNRIRRLRGHTGEITGLRFLGDSDTIATTSADGRLRIWSIRRGRVVQTFGSKGQEVQSLSVAPDFGRIATASNDGWVRIWDIRLVTN